MRTSFTAWLIIIGIEGLIAFRQMLDAISGADFSVASDNILNSLWAKQTPERAKRHAEVMRTGNRDTYRGLLSFFISA